MGARDRIAKQLLANWFGKSQVVDPKGKPLVVYRGEHGNLPEGQVFHSRMPHSLTFSGPDAANFYAMEPNWHKDVAQAPRVTPGYLKIENPIINNPSDPFVDLSMFQDKFGTREARRIAHKFAGGIENTGNWFENYGDFSGVADLLKREPKELRNLYFDAFQYLDDADEVARLRKRGYDGALHIGNGETATNMEYRIFDPSQFRSIFRRSYAVPGAAGLGALAAQDEYGVQQQ